MATATPQPPNPALHALRVGCACTLSLLAASWWRLEHANLAVWTSFMVTTKFPITTFQSGLERILGRGVGILAAVALVGVFPDAPFARLLVEAPLLLVLFYAFFSGRSAFALVNAALYLAVLVEMGRTQPGIVAQQGWEMFLAVMAGCVASDLVMWLTFAEAGLHLHPGTNALLPVNREWLNHAAMMLVTVYLTLFVGRAVGLPIDKALVSVMILTAAADVQALLLKGEFRLEGALLATAWCLGAFVVMSRLPHLSLLAAFLFAGVYIAAYLAKVLGPAAYLGSQMGLVIPLVLVVPPHEFGSLTAVGQRVGGVVIGLASSVVVAGLWPRFPLRPATGTTATR